MYYPLDATYRRGQVVVKRWNSGVFGPGLAPHPWCSPYLVRAGAQFVSLRATAADDRGTAVTETIIRAYGLR